MKQIVSQIDGFEYQKDMNSEMNIRKATRLILENKSEQVTSYYKVLISDSLISNNKQWRERYFSAFSIVANQLSDDDIINSSPGFFDYFIHFPKDYIIVLDELPIEVTDLFLQMISHQVKIHINNEQITINSIINLSLKYCSSCDDKTKEALITYIKLAEKYIAK